MATYIIPMKDGEYSTNAGTVTKIGQVPSGTDHQLSIRTSGASPAGSIEFFARASGADEFEAIPDSTVDLGAPESVLFSFKLDAYKFIVSGSTGSGEIRITDTNI